MNIKEFKNHCCGCGECCAVCPTDAIKMNKNEQGFFYPTVDESKCIDCSKCTRHCTFNTKTEDNTLLASYALKHKNEDIRANSRSGGVFTAVSDLILERGGVVYGCKLFNCKEAIHTRATTKEERDEFRGSKYIQSQTHEIFNDIKKDLENGLWVLFSGTACQVNAVKDYCGNVDCTKLLLIDIVCHGTPSPDAWADYVQYVEKLNKKKVVSVDFRDKKKFGWAEHKDTLVFSDGSDYSNNIFTRLFYSHLILREDCFECPYRNLNRVGDISIADCWGIAQNYPEFDDNKGVSLVLVNTEKGKNFFDSVSDTEYITVEMDKVMQPPLKENWEKPEQYREFWEFYKNNTFKDACLKFGFIKIPYKEPFIIKVKIKVKAFLIKIRNIVSGRK